MAVCLLAGTGGHAGGLARSVRVFDEGRSLDRQRRFVAVEDLSLLLVIPSPLVEWEHV